MNPFTLEEKTILVTGASSGIGKCVSELSAKMGASLIITGRNKDRLIDTFHKLDRALNQEHRYIQADLNVNDELQELVNQVCTIDGIVLCSGVNDKAPIKFVDKERIDKMFNTNLFGPMLLVKELLKKKKISKGASIVFISSIASIYATISNALYASSKGAINSLVRVLALELSPKKIRVNAILPGMIRTNMVNVFGYSEEELDKVIATYPLERIGETSDVANAVLYYLSDASSWVTGTNLVVDGGVTLR